MARKKQKTSTEIKFGSMPFDVEQTICSFADPAELTKQLAAELSLTPDEAAAAFTQLTNRAAPASLMRLVANLSVVAQEKFESERVPLTEAKAREIVLAFFRGERYQNAKELVLAAAGYVKAQELRRAITSESGPTWADTYTAFELATWICAGGVHAQIEIIRGTGAATRARRSAAQERVQKLVAALAAGLLKATPNAVLRWRREANNPANYERARRDLHQARSATRKAR